jgi:hypothetical protein
VAPGFADGHFIDAANRLRPSERLGGGVACGVPRGVRGKRLGRVAVHAEPTKEAVMPPLVRRFGTYSKTPEGIPENARRRRVAWVAWPAPEFR